MPILSNWIGVRVIEKKSRSRIDKKVNYMPEPCLKKELVKATKFAIEELKEQVFISQTIR